METATTTPTATTTSTGTPAAAPATSAPSTGSTPSQRPTSFAQAFEADAARTVSTSTEMPASATASPETTTAPSATPAQTGEPPKERWESILANARTKAGEDALAKWRQSYGWAEQISRDDLAAWGQIAGRMANDPVGHISDLIAEIQNHDTYGPQLRSNAARLLASARGPQRVDLEPDLVVTDANGNVLERSYSAKKQMAIMDQRLADALAPYKQESEQRKQVEAQTHAERQAQETTRAMHATVDAQFEEINGILDVSDPKSEDAQQMYRGVSALMEANPTLSYVAAATKFRNAYAKTKAEAKVLDELKTKAAANSVSPNSVGTSTKKRPTSFLDPSLKW